MKNDHFVNFSNFFQFHRDSSTLKRRGVLFADGIAPGDGTSASENSETEADDSIIKPKKLSTRAKNKKDQKINTILPPLPSEPIPMFLDKENSLEAKVNLLHMIK